MPLNIINDWFKFKKHCTYSSTLDASKIFKLVIKSNLFFKKHYFFSCYDQVLYSKESNYSIVRFSRFPRRTNFLIVVLQKRDNSAPINFSFFVCVDTSLVTNKDATSLGVFGRALHRLGGGGGRLQISLPDLSVQPFSYAPAFYLCLHQYKYAHKGHLLE